MVQHLTQDQLIQLAFDEPDTSAATEHVAGCERCRGELRDLQQLSIVLAASSQVRDLPAPPSQLWDRIAQQTGVAAPAPAPVQPAAPAVAPVAARSASARPPGRSGASRPGARRRMARLSVAAAAVAVALVTGAVMGSWWTRPAVVAQPTVLAAADLAAYGTTPKTASGQAHLVQGHRLRLHVAGLPAIDGYYEVWLIDPDTMRMFSIGTLGSAADGEFTLPANTDLGAYRLVDVSAEHFDNDTAHSGESLLRGLLA
ncbi:anti-sigma factor [Catellatospora methionotrophica]|uniref:anti-sigma factor n=1 Tax=Catellatospora methionotrophica TaxID=121620 RepID=UPI0033C2474C